MKALFELDGNKRSEDSFDLIFKFNDSEYVYFPFYKNTVWLMMQFLFFL